MIEVLKEYFEGITDNRQEWKVNSHAPYCVPPYMKAKSAWEFICIRSGCPARGEERAINNNHYESAAFIVKHNLLEIIVMTICAVIAGCDVWEDIVDFCRVKENWFRESLHLS